MCLSVIILPILLPMNVLHGNKKDNGVQGLDRLSWSNVGLTQNGFYWANLTLILGITLFLSAMIYFELATYVRFRQKSLRRASYSLHARTILLTGIPENLRSIEGLTQVFSIFFEGVETVIINRDTSRMAKILKRRRKTLAVLEAAETRLIRKALKAKGRVAPQDGEGPVVSRTQYLRMQDRPNTHLPIVSGLPSLPLLGTRVDAIKYFGRQLAKLNLDLDSEQASFTSRKSLDSAFVQFRSQLAAQLASQILMHSRLKSFQVQCVGVEAEDIIWGNIPLGWPSANARKILVMLCMFIATAGWAFPVAFSGFLSQVAYAHTFWPKFQNVSAPLAGLILGVLPQLMLTILLILIPFLIRFLAGQQGFLTVQDLELAIQRYYFTFLFVQIFLTVSVSASATTIINDVYHGLDFIPLVLASNLPKTSNYFFSYILIQGLSISANQFAQLLGLFRRIYWNSKRDKSPRQQWERKRAAFDIQWGTLYPVFTNLACIGKLQPKCTEHHTDKCRNSLLNHCTSSARFLCRRICTIPSSVSLQLHLCLNAITQLRRHVLSRSLEPALYRPLRHGSLWPGTLPSCPE